jgi:hypothetical protein
MRLPNAEELVLKTVAERERPLYPTRHIEIERE